MEDNNVQNGMYSMLDQMVNTQGIQFVKNTLPLVDGAAQKQLSILVKMIELKNTINAFSGNKQLPLLQAQSTGMPNIKSLLTEEQRSLFEMISGLMQNNQSKERNINNENFPIQPNHGQQK